MQRLSTRVVGLVVRLCAALLVYLCCAAHNGGCHPDEGEPLSTPVHALATVLEGVDGGVSVRLSLVSDGLLPNEYVSASKVTLHPPGGGLEPLEEVAPGRYALAESTQQALEYELGDYLLAFTIDPSEARRAHVFPGDFVLSLHASGAPFEATLSGEPLLAGQLTWQPAEQQALVELYDQEGTLCASNHPADPFVAAAPQWRRLASGGLLELANDAPTGPACEVGSLRACIVSTSRSAEPAYQLQHAGFVAEGLSSRSGMLIGRCQRWSR